MNSFITFSRSAVILATVLGLARQSLSTPCLAQQGGVASHKALPSSPVLSHTDGAIDVVAGDLLWIGIHKIKLDAIVSLNTAQICSLDGRDRRCAIRMRDALASFAKRDNFRCELILTRAGRPKFSRGGRYSALCFAGDIEINQELVALGWALAADRRYQAAEDDARSHKRGIHRYDFEDPRTPPAADAWSRLRRLIQRYPLMFAGGPAIAFIVLLLAVVVIRWRARRQVAQLKYDLGKVQRALEATIKPLPPRPQPIKSLDKR